MRKALLVSIALAIGLGPQPASGHDGTAIAIDFTGPVGLVDVQGDVLVITWDDKDEAADATHRLYAQTQNIPPTHVPMTAHLMGELLHEVAASDTANTFQWDVSQVPTGVYAIYATTTEPDICQHVEFLPAAVVVHHPDDDPPLGVMVTSPLEGNVVALETAEIQLKAVSETPPFATLTAGRMRFAEGEELDGDSLCDPFRQTWDDAFDVADQIPMEPDPEAGPDRWRLTVSWDTREIGNDFYALRADVENSGEQWNVGWSHAWIAALYSPAMGGDATDGPDTTGQEDTGPNPGDAQTATQGIRIGGGGDAGCATASGAQGHELVSLCALWGLWLTRRRWAPLVIERPSVAA